MEVCHGTHETREVVSEYAEPLITPIADEAAYESRDMIVVDVETHKLGSVTAYRAYAALIFRDAVVVSDA